MAFGKNDSYGSDDSEEEVKSTPKANIEVVSQNFRRSTKPEEIQDAINKVNASTKPLHVSFLAGSIHGSLGSELKEVQTGLTSFLRSLQHKTLEKLVISTGK